MGSRSEIAARGGAWGPALLLFLLCAGLGSGTAEAQPLEEALEDCLAVKHDRARLACFEALARGEAMPSSTKSEPARAPRAAPARGESETPARASAPEPSADSMDLPASAPAAEPARADSNTGDRFGLPEVSEPKQPEEQRREMVIAEARPLPRDKGMYIMENGQVWTLVSGTFRPVDPGTPVVIEEGWLGSYRMVVEDGWTYRVRRLR